MIVNLVGQPRFHFIGIFVVGLAVGLGKAEGLAIGAAVSTGVDVAVGFSGLSLW